MVKMGDYPKTVRLWQLVLVYSNPQDVLDVFPGCFQDVLDDAYYIFSGSYSSSDLPQFAQISDDEPTLVGFCLDGFEARTMLP